MSHLMTKPTKWHVRPAKTQTSLGIRLVWSESSLSAWRKLGSLATLWANSEDSDQTGRMPRLICFGWAHMPFCWFCLEAVQNYSSEFLNECHVLLVSVLEYNDHPPSLITFTLCAQWVVSRSKNPKLVNADSEDSDRTGRMPRLI